MLIRRSERVPSAPITAAGTVRSSRTGRTQTAEGQFDQINLSAPVGQEFAPTFREMAASLSQQVRTLNTTGKIQELHRQVSSGEYRPDARETAARMLLMMEGE